MKKVFLFVLLSFSYCVGLGQIPKLILPTGHSKQVISMAYSSDGKLLATGAEDNKIIIWDTRSGKIANRLTTHVGKIICMAFSPNNKYLVSGSEDKAAILWDVSSGKVSQVITPQNTAITVTSFSPDGKYIIVGCTDGKSFVWSVDSSKIHTVLTDQRSKAEYSFLDRISPFTVRAASFSNNGIYCYVHFNDGLICAYQSASGKIIYTDNTVTSSLFQFNQRMAGFSPSDDYLVMLKDNGYQLVDLKDTTKKKYAALTKGKSFINFNITPTEDSLIAIHESGAFFIWNLKTGDKPVINKLPAPAYYYQAYFHPDGKTVMTASGDSSIRSWDLARGKLIHQVKAGSVIQLQFDPKYDFYAICELRKEVVIRDNQNGAISMTLGAHTININNTLFDAKRKRIWSTSTDRTIRIWNIHTGKIEHTIEGIDKADFKLANSPRGKYIYTFYSNIVNIYDAEKTSLLYQLGNGPKYDIEKKTFNLITSASISPDERLIAASSADHTIRIWNLESGKLLSTLVSGEWGITKCQFSFDGKYIASIDVLGKITLWNVAGKTIRDTVRTKPFNGNFFLSTTGNFFSYQNSRGAIVIYDIEQKKELQELETLKGDECQLAVFSSNNKRILLCSMFMSELWDISTQQKLFSIEQAEYSILNAKIYNDSIITIISSDGKLHQYDENTGKEIGHLKIGDRAIVDIDGPFDNIFPATGSESIYLYNMEKGYTILFTAIDKNGSIVTTDKGWNMSTPDAAHWVRWELDNKVYDFDQWDFQYNRPDKVLELLGNTDSTLHTAYRMAWEKRLRKLGIDSLQFISDYSLPELTLLNLKDLEGYSKSDNITLKIVCADPNEKNRIEKVFITIDGCPVFGRQGLKVAAKKSYSIIEIPVKLSWGINTIKVSCQNDKGAESLRQTIFINYKSDSQLVSKTYFIGVGIDRFQDSRHNLQYSSKDIRDLAIKLKEKYNDNIIIDTLFNENVTTTNVKKLKEKLLKTSVNDKVMVSYSGHGLLSKDYDYYLSTYSVNFNKPEENGLPYDELENLLDSIPARKKLMLIDACHSGEVDKEEMQRYAQSESKLDTGVKGARKLELNNNAKLGMKNSFELMQNLFVNVGKSTGATIISAAAGTQFALERSDLKNGVFTYCILEEMKKNIPTTISQLKKIVGEQVEKMTNGLQKPTSRNENVAVDWHVW
jgi:WD40 repeat protein